MSRSDLHKFLNDNRLGCIVCFFDKMTISDLLEMKQNNIMDLSFNEFKGPPSLKIRLSNLFTFNSLIH